MEIILESCFWKSYRSPRLKGFICFVDIHTEHNDNREAFSQDVVCLLSPELPPAFKAVVSSGPVLALSVQVVFKPVTRGPVQYCCLISPTCS